MSRHLSRWILCLGLLGLSGVLLTAPLQNAPVTSAQVDALCFEETGQCIFGAIRSYWETNGGLAVFGYPITPVETETIDNWTGPVQWFQRDRLEDHGSDGVLAGRLGALALELQGRPWDLAFDQVSPAAVPSSCAYFFETGHSLCPPFLDYWAINGGVERFGFPITEAMVETVGNWTGTVQYFERRRMELHPELSGSPVLLGLLGQEILDRLNTTNPPTTTTPTPTDPSAPPAAGPTPECVNQLLRPNDRNSRLLRDAYEQVTFRAIMGCPVAYLRDRPASTQRMERGEMLWIDNGSPSGGVPASVAGRSIYVMFEPGPTYGRYPDTWQAGVDPMRPDIEAPRDGLYPPWGGFGKLWLIDSNVRNGVGWALTPQALEDEADIVIFDNVYNDPNNLGAMVLFQATDTVYVFGRLDKPAEVQVIPAQ